MKLDFIDVLQLGRGVVFKAECTDENRGYVVAKFLSKEFNSNEFDIMMHLHEHSGRSDLFHKPLFCKNLDGTDVIIILTNGKNITVHSPGKFIVYPFIEGESLTNDYMSAQDHLTFPPGEIYRDILEQITIIHALGFVHGDICIENIIRKPNGRYTLIDYGESFSVSHSPYIPYNYASGESIPDKQSDIKRLVNLIDYINKRSKHCPDDLLDNDKSN